MYTAVMKTDETNLPRDPANVPQRISVPRTEGAMPAHVKSSAEREQDALEEWRRQREHGGGPPDPVAVHGFDLDTAEPPARKVISAFSEDLARLHSALEVAEHRLEAAEQARRFEPETGLFRRDALFGEIRHLEVLDQREGAESRMALMRIDGFERFRETEGRGAAERLMTELGRALAEIDDPAEPIGRVGDGEFAVLLTGLHGDAATARARRLAQHLIAAVDSLAEAEPLRPGSVSIGFATLHAGEDPLDILSRADKDRVT
jgi:diguanylate cyclase (GGDEF)-like protein